MTAIRCRIEISDITPESWSIPVIQGVLSAPLTMEGSATKHNIHCASQGEVRPTSHCGVYHRHLCLGFLRDYVTSSIADKDNGKKKSCALKTWQLLALVSSISAPSSQYFALFCWGNCKTSPANCGFPDFDPVILVGMSSGRHDGTWPQAFCFPGSLISVELDTFTTVERPARVWRNT